MPNGQGSTVLFTATSDCQPGQSNKDGTGANSSFRPYWPHHRSYICMFIDFVRILSSWCCHTILSPHWAAVYKFAIMQIELYYEPTRTQHCYKPSICCQEWHCQPGLAVYPYRPDASHTAVYCSTSFPSNTVERFYYNTVTIWQHTASNRMYGNTHTSGRYLWRTVFTLVQPSWTLVHTETTASTFLRHSFALVGPAFCRTCWASAMAVSFSLALSDSSFARCWRIESSRVWYSFDTFTDNIPN